ncbi:MAG: hypothetical protein IPG59_02655 [Candidatus Melainabacteria bacterium]|nr:MAG: hypothetical protein IPG59_02655 [Candidatus Melainabacteria bacterium]
MTNRKLALLSFGIPFFLGGGFIGVGVLADQLQHPDNPLLDIIMYSVWSVITSGTQLGLLSLAIVFLFVGAFRLLKKLKK